VTDADRRDDLWRLYENAVAEYRFEVTLNNQRFQWYVGLNFAVVTVGAALLRIGKASEGRGIVVVAFAAGIVLAAFTAALARRQAIYYRRARDLVRKIAAELGVTEWSVQTTGGFSADEQGQETVIHGPQVRTINYALLGALAALNVGGIVYVLRTG
jgi:hypothetical protein